MSILHIEMPVLARHQGDWVGKYTLIDNEGNIFDQHNSHLTCQFLEAGPYPYYQINRYTWLDGKQEEHHFPGTYQDKKLWFDTERIYGKAWEVDDATIVLWFSYKTMPDIYMYEISIISPCNNFRSRTWHAFKNHQNFKRTLIEEERLR